MRNSKWQCLGCQLTKECNWELLQNKKIKPKKTSLSCQKVKKECNVKTKKYNRSSKMIEAEYQMNVLENMMQETKNN